MAKPLCQYFGICAGCSSQHIDYPTQIGNKKKLLANLLHTEINCYNGKEYYYRNRMEFLFGSKEIGLRKKGEHGRIVDIEKCVICNEKVNVILNEVRLFFKRHPNPAYKFVVVRATEYTSSVSIVLNSTSSSLTEAVENVREFSTLTSTENVIVTYIKNDENEAYSNDYFIVKGADVLKESLLGKWFFYPVQGFFQNNSEVVEKIHKYCYNLLKGYDTKKYSLLDLYAGVGVFATINADIFESVVLAERSRQSLDLSKINLKNNGALNAKSYLLDAKQLKKVQFKNDIFVITDPPRSGMDMKVIGQLKKIKPKLILYISCNPFQLRKDISKFKEYQIKSVAMFDMFPQTNHIEAVVELVKSSPQGVK